MSRKCVKTNIIGEGVDTKLQLPNIVTVFQSGGLPFTILFSCNSITFFASPGGSGGSTVGFTVQCSNNGVNITDMTFETGIQIPIPNLSLPPSIDLTLPILGANVKTIRLCDKNTITFEATSSFTDELLSTIVNLAIPILTNIVSCASSVLISSLSANATAVITAIFSALEIFALPSTFGEFIDILFNSQLFKDALGFAIIPILSTATQRLFAKVKICKHTKAKLKQCSKITFKSAELPPQLCASVNNIPILLSTSELYQKLGVLIEDGNLPCKFFGLLCNDKTSTFTGAFKICSV